MKICHSKIEIDVSSYEFDEFASFVGYIAGDEVIIEFELTKHELAEHIGGLETEYGPPIIVHGKHDGYEWLRLTVDGELLKDWEPSVEQVLSDIEGLNNVIKIHKT